MEDMEILTVPLTEMQRRIRAEEYELGDKDNPGNTTH